MDFEIDIDPNAVCRVCLSQSNKLQNLFTSTIVDGYLTSLPEMLTSTLGITAELNDELPDKICNVCKPEITRFYIFKQKSKRIEEVLHKTFKKSFQESKPEENITTADVTINETAKDDADGLHIISEDCPKENIFYGKDSPKSQPCQQVESEEAHHSKVESTSHRTHDCDKCSSTFKTENLLTKHFEECHCFIKNELLDQELLEMLEDDGEESVAEQSNTDFMENIDFVESESMIVEELTEVDDDEDGFMDEIFEEENVEAESEENEISENNKRASDDQTDHNETSCNVCNVNFDQKTEHVRHLEQHEFSCKSCLLVFEDLETQDEHTCNTRGPKSATRKPRKVTSGRKYPYTCKYCVKHFRNKSLYDTHMNLHEKMSEIINTFQFFLCKNCRVLFITEEKFTEHKGICRNEDKHVDNSCTDYQFLEDDAENLLENKDTRCGICPQIYPNLTELKHHIVMHSEMFICPFEGCGCQYDIFNRFILHVMQKHNESSHYECRHCPDTFDTFDGLQEHMKSCSSRIYECIGHCDKKFFSRKALINHLNISKGKKFECQECGKAFGQNSELKLHKRTHTGERPFVCTICGKSYKTSSMRSAHMDAHIEGKTFPCTLCDIKLQSRPSYRNHMKRHTESKKHECEGCGKMFYTKFHLNLHYSKIHKKLAQPATAEEQYEMEIQEAAIFFGDNEEAET